ncbi:hypothetical protein B0H63DRAFT_445053 [Podospora didyma]|uniref:Uncharacterized protein n=1 Tax=Podospora didyma TaxID=330526 RepID=A0AAE0U912_9PEZI|nr:hypothetical protein B0H63DRAFT_445053 [Podospora didyma]
MVSAFLGSILAAGGLIGSVFMSRKSDTNPAMELGSKILPLLIASLVVGWSTYECFDALMRQVQGDMFEDFLVIEMGEVGGEEADSVESTETAAVGREAGNNHGPEMGSTHFMSPVVYSRDAAGRV